MENKKNVDTFGEALGVLVQVAHLAQTKGILTLDEARIVAQSLDRVDEFRQLVVQQQEKTVSSAVTEPGPTSNA